MTGLVGLLSLDAARFRTQNLPNTRHSYLLSLKFSSSSILPGTAPKMFSSREFSAHPLNLTHERELKWITVDRHAKLCVKGYFD